MKKTLVSLILASTLIIAGCNDTPRSTKHHDKPGHRHVHHFSDGRVGYMDNTGLWWYLATHGGGSSSTSGSYSSTSSWVRSSQPSNEELAASKTEVMEVQNESDQTLDQPETTTESAEAEGDPSVPDMGEPEEAVYDNVEPADSDTGMSDSGSADSGGSDSGGGDSGGGGE